MEKFFILPRILSHQVIQTLLGVLFGEIAVRILDARDRACDRRTHPLIHFPKHREHQRWRFAPPTAARRRWNTANSFPQYSLLKYPGE